MGHTQGFNYILDRSGLLEVVVKAKLAVFRRQEVVELFIKSQAGHTGC